jgi:hypothetical protein
MTTRAAVEGYHKSAGIKFYQVVFDPPRSSEFFQHTIKLPSIEPYQRDPNRYPVIVSTGHTSITTARVHIQQLLSNSIDWEYYPDLPDFFYIKDSNGNRV